MLASRFILLGVKTESETNRGFGKGDRVGKGNHPLRGRHRGSVAALRRSRHSCVVRSARI